MEERQSELTGTIIGAAMDIHRALGPGLLESTYEACLAFELRDRGLKVEQQKALPVRYRGVNLDCGYRIDLLVEDIVIVELKAIERLEKFTKPNCFLISSYRKSKLAYSSISMSKC